MGLQIENRKSQIANHPAIIALGLFLLPMAMLYPLWSSPTAAGEDDVVFFYPLRVLAAGELKQGHLPLWNPFSATGTSLMADPQSAVFFPPNWLFIVLPAKLAYSLCLFLAFGCAGAGAFLYLRRLGLMNVAAIFGAIAFEFCGFMVGHRVHLGVIQTAAMLPWALLGVEMFRRGQNPEDGGAYSRRGMRPLAMLAAAMALALAAGHWPTVIQMSLAVAAYLLIRARPMKWAIPAALGAVLLAGLLTASQIYITQVGLHSTFRAGLTYSTATENSFFPLAGVLAFFPFLLGNRTPNVFSQPWWGPSHQCEMFGYIGLVTLILAGAALASLYRRRDAQSLPADAQPDAACLRPAVRLWTWLGVAAFVWMLGGYLPTYRLVYLLPVLGKVRCPGRMILVLDMALATLAAIGLHWWLIRRDERAKRTLNKACVALAAVMCLLLLALLVTARAGWLEALAPLLNSPGAVAKSLRTALNLKSSAFYVPLAMLAATVIALAWTLAGSSRRAWILLPLLLADLFIPCRFIDVPPSGQRVDPSASPAAAWLVQNAPKEPYRVWGLSRDYHHRPAELLLPNVSAIFGIESISYYGPLQPLEHARLFGFKPWGETYSWPWLIRDNRLLSLFNVRYIVAADPVYREVIESVHVASADQAASLPAENLLTGLSDVRLQAVSSFHADERSQNVTLAPGAVYRIELDARAQQGADNMVVAGWFPGSGQPWWQESPARLRLDSEQLSPQWRHFEWMFSLALAGEGRFLLATTSVRPVELRNVTLRPAAWEQPAYQPDLPVRPGEAAYVDRTPQGLPTLRPGDPPVHIYENLLVGPRQWKPQRVTLERDAATILERLRWDKALDLRKEVLAAEPMAQGDFRAAAAAAPELVSGPTATRADLLGELISRDEPRRPSPLIVLLLWVQAGAVLLLLALATWPVRARYAWHQCRLF